MNETAFTKYVVRHQVFPRGARATVGELLQSTLVGNLESTGAKLSDGKISFVMSLFYFISYPIL